MNDLILRTAAIEAFDDKRVERNYGDVSLESVIKVIESLPVVDAEMVVRCRDCKYAHMTCSGECKYCDFWQEEGGDSLYLDGDFFCAAGERRDEE